MCLRKPNKILLCKSIEVWPFILLTRQYKSFSLPATCSSTIFHALSRFFFPLGGLKNEIRSFCTNALQRSSGHIFHMRFWNNIEVIFLAIEKYRILE